MRQKSSSMFARLSIELYRSINPNHWPLMLGSRYPWNPILWVVTIFEAHFLATFLCSLCLNLIDQNPFNSTYFNSGRARKKFSLVHNSLPALQASLLLEIDHYYCPYYHCPYYYYTIWIIAGYDHYYYGLLLYYGLLSLLTYYLYYGYDHYYYYYYYGLLLTITYYYYTIAGSNPHFAAPFFCRRSGFAVRLRLPAWTPNSSKRWPQRSRPSVFGRYGLIWCIYIYNKYPLVN